MTENKFEPVSWERWIGRLQQDSHKFAPTLIEGFLRDGNADNPYVGSRVLHLLLLPAFTEMKSYELFHYTRTDSYMVLRTIWFHAEDIDRIRTSQRMGQVISMEPTFDAKSISFPNDRVDCIFSQLEKPIPPAFSPRLPEKIGLDGVYYELAFAKFRIEARYRWWEAPLEPWAPLATAFDYALQAFEEALA